MVAGTGNVRTEGGGSVFRDMAAKFQANVRKRSNNDWGSIIQEGVLVSEMIGTDVSRTLKVKLTQFKKSVSRIFNLTKLVFFCFKMLNYQLDTVMKS